MPPSCRNAKRGLLPLLICAGRSSLPWGMDVLGVERHEMK